MSSARLRVCAVVAACALLSACTAGSGERSASPGGGPSGSSAPSGSSGPGGGTPTASGSPPSATPSAPDDSPAPRRRTIIGRPGLPAPPGSASVRVVGTVASGLSVPWGVAFLPDGSALVSERDRATIVRIAPSGSVREVGTVPGVAAGSTSEGGLLGLAVSPEFGSDHLVYAYETTATDNRVVAMRLDEGRLGAPRPILTGIPRGVIHNGGRLLFGPDGMLYVSTGETGDSALAQNRRSLGGKILRITPRGRPAPGDPWPGSPVWSYGHRNVEGLAFDARNRLWADEFGDSTWDELNRILPGRNYGWPAAEGAAHLARYVDPLVQWRTPLASPSGLAYAHGSLWLAALHGARLWQVPVHADGTVGRPVDYLVGDYGRLRTVVAAPDGTLWVTTSNRDGRGIPQPGDDRILRVALS